ncbi:MAG: TIGR02281 family clan AA aspartic protease [Myxococcales bacterium]|nr:TIGR02281 family clan AA aspartic protease [Myxococcales bacterium]
MAVVSKFVSRLKAGSLARIAGWFLLVGILFFCVSASAEIYRWIDESGRMHFTQDLGQVPLRYRTLSKAAAEAPKGRSPVQHYTPPKLPARLDTGHASRGAGGTQKTHRIRVERAGSSMRVSVRINDRLDVPFIIDTGATDVVLPAWAAKELGLAIEGPGVRTSPRQTANGLIHAPVLMLESVKLGSAEVKNVAGLVISSMSEGLLGLSFFNHFTYNIDAANGIVTLTPNGLAENGTLRGGRSKGQWSAEFRSLHRQIELAESHLGDMSAGRSRERSRLEAYLEKSEERLRLLDTEADQARVPFPWRD